MDNLSQLIATDHETRKKFVYNMFAGGTDGQLTDEQLDETCNLLFFLKLKQISLDNIRYYHCQTQNSVFHNYIDCLGWTLISKTN